MIKFMVAVVLAVSCVTLHADMLSETTHEIATSEQVAEDAFIMKVSRLGLDSGVAFEAENQMLRKTHELHHRFINLVTAQETDNLHDYVKEQTNFFTWALNDWAVEVARVVQGATEQSKANHYRFYTTSVLRLLFDEFPFESVIVKREFLRNLHDNLAKKLNDVQAEIDRIEFKLAKDNKKLSRTEFLTVSLAELFAGSAVEMFSGHTSTAYASAAGIGFFALWMFKLFPRPIPESKTAKQKMFVDFGQRFKSYVEKIGRESCQMDLTTVQLTPLND